MMYDDTHLFCPRPRGRKSETKVLAGWLLGQLSAVASNLGAPGRWPGHPGLCFVVMWPLPVCLCPDSPLLTRTPVTALGSYSSETRLS